MLRPPNLSIYVYPQTYRLDRTQLCLRDGAHSGLTLCLPPLWGSTGCSWPRNTRLERSFWARRKDGESPAGGESLALLESEGIIKGHLVQLTKQKVSSSLNSDLHHHLVCLELCCYAWCQSKTAACHSFPGALLNISPCYISTISSCVHRLWMPMLWFAQIFRYAMVHSASKSLGFLLQEVMSWNGDGVAQTLLLF